MEEHLQLRIHGEASLPTLVYLPGLHGDWTLVSSFRTKVAGRARFVEITYPRTLEWSLDDYAANVSRALVGHGVRSGWLLAESFGSQPAWQIVARAQHAPPDEHRFQPAGLILAGGFARHPFEWGVRLAKRAGGQISLTLLTRLLFWYARVARFRHRHAPETLASIDEFIARRTELDRLAAVHRLDLILINDLRPAARSAAIPVFALSGLWDPIVPWPWTFRWLRRHCPALKATRLISAADHNVLGTAPGAAARQVLQWIGAPD